MRWEDIYLAGIGSYLPEGVQTAAQAVAAGLYDADERAANGIRSVRVAGDGEAPAVMAAAAARRALAASGLSGRRVGLTLHACMGHQGQDFWTPASYVQNETAVDGTAVEVRQGSNGGLAALELAASYVTARPDVEAALLTTGDAFILPYVNRWSSENQQVYGDGAGALLLSRRSGFARLRSTVTLSDPTLEPLYRGTAGWTDAPFHDGTPVDLRERKRAYLLREPHRYDEVIERTNRHAELALRQALRDAGTELSAARFVLHPTLGRTVVEYAYHERLGIDPSVTTYDWARDLGHLGAGDQFVALDHLVTGGLVEPGDLVVALGVGIGFVWTAAVLEILDAPAGRPLSG